MPLLYGEGKRAFRRLQLKILSGSDDHSIFAWTKVHESGRLPEPVTKKPVSIPGVLRSRNCRSTPGGELALVDVLGPMSDCGNQLGVVNV